LGLIGSLGFAAIAIILLRSCAVSGTRKVLIILSALTSVLFLFGTIGGLGSLFSSLISSSIRGWNRISVFIGFGSIAVFLLLVDYWTQRLGKCRQPAYAIWLSAILIGVIGFYDQTTRTCPNCNDKVRKAFESDRQFISAIEGILPTGSAVYQLPYIVFPEGAIINRLGSYDMLAGFLHSRTLKWNLGGMKEREGDLFYKSLSQQPLKQQIDTIQTLGFAGIYVDKRGFADDGKKIENDLSLQFGKGPDLVSASGDQIFYALPKPTQNVEHLSSKAIMQLVNYQNTESAQVTFGKPIEFSQVQLPSHVEKITGLSNPEPWGRWSDANLSPSVTVKFKQPLPHQFNLVIEAKSFVAEPNQRLRITIGSFVFEPKLTSDFSKITIPVNLDQEVVDKIVLTPQKTVSPSALGLGSDNRELGVGLRSLQIVPSTIGSFKK
jgi:phosphoglycerol transferase